MSNSISLAYQNLNFEKKKKENLVCVCVCHANLGSKVRFWQGFKFLKKTLIKKLQNPFFLVFGLLKNRDTFSSFVSKILYFLVGFFLFSSKKQN